jgi:hypothetical protein
VGFWNGTATTPADLVTHCYQNILHRAPDSGGLDFRVGVLTRHDAAAADVLAAIGDSQENVAGTAALVDNGIAYVPYLG